MVFFHVAAAHPGRTGLRDAIVTGTWVTIGAFALAAIAALVLPRVTARPGQQGDAVAQDEPAGELVPR